MKPKLLVLLLLMVLGPLGILGWLGTRVARQEQERIRQQFQEALRSQLEQSRTDVARSLLTRGRKLVQGMESLPYETAALRNFVRRTPLVQQVFLVDPEGRRRHPPTEGDLSPTEQEFLERTRLLWQRKHIFYHLYGPPEEQASLPGSAQSQGLENPEESHESSTGPQRPPSPTSPTQGWYTWYWERGTHLILWQRNDDGWILGVELDRIRIISDLIGQLPETRLMEPNLPNGCITLAESNGDVLYRWGNYEPAQKEPPQVSLELSPPLHSWKLHFFAPGQELAAAFGRTALFQLVSGLAVVGMALLGLAVVFYREYSREIREATQRVTFVNQVSHELRTPLTNIRMYAELLENVAGEDPEKSSRYLSIILSESQRLSRLISNVLTFGRQQKETLKLHLTSGNVDEVIASVIEQFRPSMETRGIEISVSRGAGAEVLLDADALQQILGNLFSNVEKYAATGKFMAVASQQTTDQTTITVTDRGPGIPATQEEKIFRPFYRISDKVSEGVTGTGIGLSIARHLARLHGGDVVLILSTTGACFRVTLHAPRAEAARS